MAKMRTDTRVPTDELKPLVDDAKLSCRIAREAIASRFPRLTADDRKRAASPSANFTKTTRKVLGGADEFHDLMKTADVSEEAVLEDIDNLDLLYPLQREVDLLKQVTDDAVLLSGDEAYRSMLKVYAMAKVIAENRPEAEEIVKMISALFTPARGNGGGNKSGE